MIARLSALAASLITVTVAGSLVVVPTELTTVTVYWPALAEVTSRNVNVALFAPLIGLPFRFH